MSEGLMPHQRLSFYPRRLVLDNSTGLRPLTQTDGPNEVTK